MNTSTSLATRAVRGALKRRWLHSTSTRAAVSNLQMPAMSPTMTEGGIASWKVREGDSFSAGDVLLEIETDKATIDVEAQDDGIVGKIIAPDGTKNVPVGKVIALLAEEGDDISNLEAPKDEPQSVQKKEEPKSSPSPDSTPSTTSTKNTHTSHTPTSGHSLHVPTHSKPLFPSVLRLLQEHGVADPEKIKGTGIRGMLTKGDVLAFLGKASGPSGTYKEPSKVGQKPAVKKEVKAPLDGAAIRRLIVSSLLEGSKPKAVASEPATFDSIIADYLAPPLPSPKTVIPTPPSTPSKRPDFLDGLV